MATDAIIEGRNYGPDYSTENDLPQIQIDRMRAWAAWHLGSDAWAEDIAEAATDPCCLENLAEEGCELAAELLTTQEA